MTSSTFSGLGGGASHSLRDVGKAEPSAEVDRPIASQGINVDMRSLFELPVTQNPHNDARTWGCGLETEDISASDSRANYDNGRLYNTDMSSKANPMRMDTPDNTNSFVQRGTWKTDRSMYDSANVRIAQTEVRPEAHSEIRRRSDNEIRQGKTIEFDDTQYARTNYANCPVPTELDNSYRHSEIRKHADGTSIVRWSEQPNMTNPREANRVLSTQTPDSLALDESVYYTAR